MCCFSGPVKSVADTRIFCRVDAEGRQFVIYSMVLDAPRDLAMILPIPVKPGTGEDDVAFLDFSKFPDFFDDLDSGFPQPLPATRAGPRGFGGADTFSAPLNVVTVGSFDASFVPTVADFERLDERFRLPATTWDALPGFKDHGFVVFKLREGRARVHPMAFTYPALDPKTLVFPTVHIHDGEVHERALFDHSLYFQGGSSKARLAAVESTHFARDFVDPERAHGAVEPDAHVYKLGFHTVRANEDIRVAAM